MNRNQDKPPICRLTSLKGFQGVILGRDLGNILEEGHVYSVVRILDEIILTDLGKHATDENFAYHDINGHAMNGVAMLTEAEYATQIFHQQFG